MKVIFLTYALRGHCTNQVKTVISKPQRGLSPESDHSITAPWAHSPPKLHGINMQLLKKKDEK